jgi:hypothetical protein
MNTDVEDLSETHHSTGRTSELATLPSVTWLNVDLLH